jgi:hypothetical protein
VTVIDRRLTWLSVCSLATNTLWTVTWFAYVARITSECPPGDECLGALIPLFFWLLGEAVLAPLTLGGIAFLLLRWGIRTSTEIAALASLGSGGLVLLSAVIFIAGIW